MDRFGHTESLRDLRVCRVLLEYAVQSHELDLDNFDKLDSKSGMIAGFLGVIFTVAAVPVVGFLTAPTDTTMETSRWALAVTAKLLCLGAVATFSLALLTCLQSIAIRRIKHTAPVMKAVAKYRSIQGMPEVEQQILKNLIKTIGKAQEGLRSLAIEKSGSLRETIECLRVTILLFGFVLALHTSVKWPY